MMQINTSTLADLRFFKGLPEPHLKKFVENAMSAEFRAAEFIFHEGERANCFYVVLDGGVALVSRERAQLIETIGPGDLLGWSWLFPPYFWRFSAHAVLPVKAAVFHAAPLREACENDHDFGYELMKRVAEVVVERLQATPYQLPQKPDKI
jgi:CRP/FNR family transcriptional regulator, cyclic AMP receptor protein